MILVRTHELRKASTAIASLGRRQCSVCILQLDLVLGKPRGQALHASQRALSLPYRNLEHFAIHPHNQRWQWRFIHSTSKTNTPQKYTRKRRLAGNLSDLRHGTLVWRPCWISGGYRLEAASRPIALYIVGIREAQGRSQHFYVWYRNMVERILVGDGGLSWQIRTG